MPLRDRRVADRVEMTVQLGVRRTISADLQHAQSFRLCGKRFVQLFDAVQRHRGSDLLGVIVPSIWQARRRSTASS